MLVSSGHDALDHRVFHKEAVSLAQAFPQVRVVAGHPMGEVRDGVKITALAPCRHRLERFLWRPLQVYLAARGPHTRVLILQDAELLPLAPLVRLFTGWRLIYDVHEDFSQLIMRRAWLPIPLRRSMSRLFRMVERLASRACTGITGATEVLTEYFAPLPRVAVHNLPSRGFLAEAEAVAQPTAARAYDLVHLGTLSDERLEFLCVVFSEIFARRPATRALVLGVTPAQENLLRQRFPAQQLTVIGQIDYGQVAAHLGNCRIGLNVHPVLYPHLRCAVPVKVFEYMAAGCNVITSFLPELHRLLGDEGREHVVTISTPDTERFTEETLRLLESPESLARHRAALETLVRARWNWDAEAEKLISFVDTILQGSVPATQEQPVRQEG